jgi:hypothetical protein
VFGHPPGVGKRLTQQHLDLGIDAAELVACPPDECVVDGRVEAE